MPSVSPAQHRLMEAAAHTPGGYGGVPRKVGKEFIEADDEGGNLEGSEKTEGASSHGAREDQPAGVFLEPGERKYPVKVKRDGGWKYDRDLLLAAAREARMHGHADLAERADAIRAREFKGASDSLAFDRASVRTYDADGRLHVELTNISKANVCDYLGAEIPDADKLGLRSDQVYRLYRDPAELKKGAATFNNLPLLSKHVPVSADEPMPHLVVGSTGTDAVFATPFLRNSLVVWDAAAIAGIETGDQKELSCAYRYVPVMEPGEIDGEKYDGRMTEIIGNHVALVETGRAGSDVVVGDSAMETGIMKAKTALSRRAAHTHGALAMYLRPKLAADAKLDLRPLVSGITQANWQAEKPKLAASVTTLVRGKLAKDADMGDIVKLLDSLDDNVAADDMIDGDPAAMDDEAETEEEKKARMEKRAKDKAARDKAAKDAETDPAMDDDDDDDDEDDDEKKKDKPMDKRAMDAAIGAAVAAAKRDAEAATIARLNEIRAAEKAVYPYVGEIAIAQDSAEKVYRLALDAMGIDVAGVHPSAYPAILRAQQKPTETTRVTIGMDSAGVSAFEAAFPTAARIKL